MGYTTYNGQSTFQLPPATHSSYQQSTTAYSASGWSDAAASGAGAGAGIGMGMGADPSYGGLQLPAGGQVHLPLNSQMNEGQLPKQFMGATELVKVTAKSCGSCRVRKVKCDRRYPECSRCAKRKEQCEYGDDISIALRPTWVLATEARDDSSAPAAPPPALHPSFQLPPPPAAPAPRPPYAGSAYPYPSSRPSALTSSYDFSRSLRTVSNMQHHQAVVRSRRTGEDEDDVAQQNFARLWESFLKASNLGASSSDWRLAIPTLASSLSIHLIDASMHSCCFHLPAFHAFAPDVPYYKDNIDSLDIASQVVVGILTSLGARASPHSALLGVAGPDIENGKASLEVVLSAGLRRENAWRAIVDQATELCSKPEVLQVPTARNAKTLVAFVQMLMLAEAKPKTARFFLRTAMGVFRDMQHSDLAPSEIDAIKAVVGPTLFESDSRIAAFLSMPVLISDEDLCEYFDGTGVHVPDLAVEDLGPLLDDIFDPAKGPVTRVKLDHALALTGYFVCAVQRCFSSISAGRRSSNRFLETVPRLWQHIDRAHAAVQKFHRRLVQLDYVPAGCDDHHSVDYDLLIGVRMDVRLLDVVHLAHEWLKNQRNSASLSRQDLATLEELLATSERRVRKCLKLLAFYSKVFVDSLDKHVVYHLVTQLEALPDWATMAAQREGEMTDFGPLPAECALTEVELDWFTKALELACFFTPLAHDRLSQLASARAALTQPAGSVLEQWQFDLSVPPSSTRQPQNGHAHHLPPNPHAHSVPSGAPTASSHSVLSGPSHAPSPLRAPGDSEWSFDSYGTPFVDNVSPPSLHATPSSSGSAPEIVNERLQPHPAFGSSFELGGAKGHLPRHASSLPPSEIPSYAPPPLNHQSAAEPLPSPNGLPPANSFGAAEPSWLSGHDYSAMLSAETGRTGITPRGTLTTLPNHTASIIELPDDVVGPDSSGFTPPPPLPNYGGQSQGTQPPGGPAHSPVGAWSGYKGGQW
ncbi:hypothetical protein JCM11641_001962 [Rhodosporidiobolus odoratus]